MKYPSLHILGTTLGLQNN